MILLNGMLFYTENISKNIFFICNHVIIIICYCVKKGNRNLTKEIQSEE